MNKRTAIAEIAVQPDGGWPLPSFGSKKQFRYWAHVHFEEDTTWGQRTWTLLVDLKSAPDATAGHVEATVYFMAPDAPEELLKEGARFELLCGASLYTTGVIRRVVESDIKK